MQLGRQEPYISFVGRVPQIQYAVTVWAAGAAVLLG